MTVSPDLLVGDVLAMIDQKRFDFRTFPVADAQGKLVGLLAGNLVKERYKAKKVAENVNVFESRSDFLQKPNDQL